MQTTIDTDHTVAGALPALALQHWMQVHEMQLQTLFAWQRSVLEMQQDWFDCWSSRYASAARIDD